MTQIQIFLQFIFYFGISSQYILSYGHKCDKILNIRYIVVYEILVTGNESSYYF